RKISRPAFATVGSSNVPTFKIMLSGRIDDSSAIDEPHSGQKCLRIGLPLPPMLLKVFRASASFGTHTSAAQALPVIGSKVLLHGTPSTIFDRCAPLDDVGDRGGPIV